MAASTRIKSSLDVRLLEELEEDQKKSVMGWLAENMTLIRRTNQRYWDKCKLQKQNKEPDEECRAK